MATIKLSPFILLVFYNCVCCSSMYTNTWAVKMVCNESCGMLEGLARKHGLENLRTVPTFVNAHTFCASRKPWFRHYARAWVDSDAINYAIKYTTEMKANFFYRD